MQRASQHVNGEVLALLASERGLPSSVVAIARPVPLPPRVNDIVVGAADTGGAVGIDLQKLLDGRLLVQGASGAGKSWTLRRLLEQTAERVQQIIIDPEGEFAGLVEVHGHLRVEAHRLDPGALWVLAQRVREHRISVLLDFSDFDRAGQMKAIAAFFSGLINSPPEHWHSALVVVDEAHLFAPFGGHSNAPPAVRSEAVSAVTDLMARGRKRGLAGVLATQRLTRLAKSVISEVHNFLIGINTLDLDVRRAAETIGWDTRRAFDRLPVLEPGNFVAVGAAFSRSPAVVTVGEVRTEHRGAAPKVTAPATVDAQAAARLLDLAELAATSEIDAASRDAGGPHVGFRAVRGVIGDPAFEAAGRVVGALRPLSPEGAGVDELARFLDLPPDQVANAIALLDGYGTLEISGDGEARAVRLDRKFVQFCVK